MVIYSGNEILLNWQHAQNRDFQYFNIYKNINASSFILLDTTTQLNYTDTIDPQQSLTYGYYVTAVYAQENESEQSNEVYLEVEGTATEDQFIKIQEINNYPNPFNPSTTITFSLTIEGSGYRSDLELCIYNIKGQKVKTFTFLSGSCRIGTSEKLTQLNVTNPLPVILSGVEGSTGINDAANSLSFDSAQDDRIWRSSSVSNQYSITWNGTDENDLPVPSGVYYYALRAGTKILATKKCLLLK